MNVTVFKRMIINDYRKILFGVDRASHFKNDMASNAIKSYLFLGKHIGFGLLNAKVASVLAKSIFFFF